MTKTSLIRLSTFTLAALLVIGGFLMDARLQLKESGLQLEYATQRALGDLTDEVAGLGRTLEKTRYAGTPVMHSALSAQLLEQSASAKAALSTLPLSQEKAERISRFLSQVGDYALALTRKSFSGALEAEDLEGLDTLSSYAEKLYAALTDSQGRVAVEGLPLLDDDFDAMAEEFAAMPTLLYDGPFSDHIAQREPLYLKGRKGVTQEEAQKLAGDLEYVGEGGGQLPVYIFAGPGEQLHITRQGGETAYYKKENHGAGQMGYEEALEAARSELEARGFADMRESYYVISDGLCTINFHAADGDVLCYPDLIKVTIELEQGGMVEFDAAGYLMNHRERQWEPPALSQEEAARSLSPLLEVESTKPALIPTPGLGEVLCWEFLCQGEKGRRVLCYINAQTGMEEQLYLLQEDEHGVLTV